jgi:flagellar motor switch protein FliG
MESTEAKQPANLDVDKEFAGLSNVQKLARLLLMLSPENATQLLRQLAEEELEAVATEMLKVNTISHEMQKEVLREFSPLAVEAATAISGGVEHVQDLLDKSVGLLRASNIIGRVSPLRAPVAAMQQIVDMDPRHLYNLLRQEQLQTIALVASYLSTEKASQLLTLMRPDMREQVIERLATLSPTSIEVVESVAESLQRKVGTGRARRVNQTGGIKVAAQLLNSLPKDVTKSILGSLREHNSDLADAVSKKMFTFEELEKLDVKSLQKILQTVDTSTLTVSLKTAGETLKAKLLSCISKRAAESIREEMNFMGPLKLAEIEAARSQIIDIVKQLEDDGEIDLDDMRHGSRF